MTNGAPADRRITLYHCRDTRSLRPLWALEEAGLAYEAVKIPFPPRYLVDDYLSINPLGTVPTMLVHGQRMTESAAMCQYIAQLSPDPSLRIEPDDADYPDYLNWLHRSDATLTFPLTIVLRYSRLEAPERRLPQAVEDYRRWFLKRAEIVEASLAGADYLCGGRFTAADIAVGYALYLAVSIGVEEIGPASLAYLERLRQRPGFVRAMAVQADMEAVL